MFNLRRLPALRLFVPYTLGIVLSFSFDIGWFWPVLWCLIAIGVFYWSIVTSIEMFYTERVAHVAILMVLMSLGYLFAWTAQELNHPNHFSYFIQDGDEVVFEGFIDSPIEPRERWTRFTFQVRAVQVEDEPPVHAFGNLQVYLDSIPADQTLEYGDHLVLRGKPNRIGSPSNPDAFDYGRYLHFQNIHYQLFTRAGDWSMTGEKSGSPIYAFALRSQHHLVEVLKKYLPTSDERAVASALILGYREDIPEELREAYAQTGAMHVLAVSGLHVGIVFFLLNYLLGRANNERKSWRFIRMSITLAGLWSFALITGGSPSVVRASSMFSLLTVGIAINRSGYVYNTLLMSAVLLLVWNPLWLASVGFQLSYLAVFGIVFFQRRLERQIYIRWIPARRVWQMICVSLAAQLMTTPISLFYFRQFPVYFWLSSLIMVPAAGVILSCGMALLVLDATLPPLASLLGGALWFFLKICNGVIYSIQNLPGALIPDIYLTPLQVILLYLALTMAMFWLAFYWNRALVYSSFIMVIFAGSVAFRSIKNYGEREIVVYDVSRNSLIEFYHRQKAVSLQSASITEKQVKYAVQGHRQRLGVKSVAVLVMDQDSSISSAAFIKKGPFIQFNEYRIVWLHGELDTEVWPTMEVDILVVGDVTLRGLQKAAEKINAEIIVFDRSCPSWMVRKWKAENPEMNIHDVGSSGAFLLNF